MITIDDIQNEWKNPDDSMRNLFVKKENINDLNKLLPDFTRMLGTSFLHIVENKNIIVSYQLLEMTKPLSEEDDSKRRFDVYPFNYNPDIKAKMNVGFNWLITKIKSDVAYYPEFVM